MKPRKPTVRELDTFKKLWVAGVSPEDIARVLPRIANRPIGAWRKLASRHGLPFYREGEGPPDKSEVNEELVRQLLRKPDRV